MLGIRISEYYEFRTKIHVFGSIFEFYRTNKLYIERKMHYFEKNLLSLL